MAKFSGDVGFVTTEDRGYGVFVPVTVEKHYYGDHLKVLKRTVSGQGINDDVRISDEISFVADAYASQHYFDIKYVVWQGVKWKVEYADFQYPRLHLSIGGMYNERTESTPEVTP